MTEHRHTALWTALALALLGAGLAGLRLGASGRRVSDGVESFWRVSYDLRFEALRPGWRARVAFPDDSENIHVYAQSVSHAGLAIAQAMDRRTNGREATLAALSNLPEARFTAEFDIHVGAPDRPGPPAPARLSVEERTRALRAEPAVQTQSPAVLDALGQAAPTPQETPETVERILEYCRSRIAFDPEGPSTAAGALRAKRGGSLGRARAMLAMCRAARIPARLVTGFLLDAEGETSPHHWVEACVERRWTPCDVLGGYAGGLPPHYVPVRRDGAGVVWDAGAEPVSTRFHQEEIEGPPGAIAASSRKPIHILELARLSPGAQRTLGLLLLLPVGALITALFRNIAGLPTFGTFSPALLALAFVNSDLRTGLVMASVLVLGGLAARRWIDRLRLLLVPRLSVILTMVVLGMALSVSALDFFGLTPTARAALLPMVILTMLIERFHVTWDEDGFREAARVLGGTAVVAAACLAVMAWDSPARLFLRFPECELLVAAALILVGRYTGYRVSELWRFRGLALVRREEPPA